MAHEWTHLLFVRDNLQGLVNHAYYHAKSRFFGSYLAPLPCSLAGAEDSISYSLENIQNSLDRKESGSDGEQLDITLCGVNVHYDVRCQLSRLANEHRSVTVTYEKHAGFGRLGKPWHRAWYTFRVWLLLPLMSRDSIATMIGNEIYSKMVQHNDDDEDY